MDNKFILSKFSFLIFDDNILTLNQRNIILSPSINNNQQQPFFTTIKYLKNRVDKLTDIYFLKLLLNEDFNTDIWLLFGYVAREYSKMFTNLAFPDKVHFLKEENLNDFIINFIKTNFIIKNNNISIIDNVSQWYRADYIKLNNCNIFTDVKQHLILKGFNHDLNKDKYYNINFKLEDIENSEIDKFFDYQDSLLEIITPYLHTILNNFSGDIILFASIFYNNFNDHIINSIDIRNKIKLMKNMIDNNIKTNKVISFKDMVNLIEEQNNNNKEIVKKQSMLQTHIKYI